MKHAEDAILFSNPTALVQMPWNYCNILRDGGLSYGDYLVWLMFLLVINSIKNGEPLSLRP